MSDVLPFTGFDVQFGWTQESPTAALRFVRKKDGKHILQQKWSITSPTRQDFIWRDVPIEVEVPVESEK